MRRTLDRVVKAAVATDVGKQVLLLVAVDIQNSSAAGCTLSVSHHDDLVAALIVFFGAEVAFFTAALAGVVRASSSLCSSLLLDVVACFR